MESIICKNCNTLFERHKSRQAKFCSNKCSNEFHTEKPINFFKTNSSEECYWAGFLFGDGNVDSKNKLQVCLSKKDLHHLTKFSIFLFGYNKVNIYSNRCHLQASSFDLCESLSRFGIIPNKTQNSTLIIPSENKKDFIRGYFDADGWYTETKTKSYNGKFYDKYVFGICSLLLENLEIINQYMPIKGFINKKKKQELYELRYQSFEDIKEIRGYLYGTPNLERKWNNVIK